ncbi:hypothetical protein BY996DRAFT_4495306 [Phakopsora pachyrhizi]|uniref:DUF7872 domain-containing protein n=1 Tax=Phakopsora pachyrhizi TaxID=170000 RepID=A0AAV0BMI2_PHAPC|nr:hypothetical protein BY996DRAFT_4495306 [Phakopsora pachyrhizi]CAH7688503.1 hypothetical protein PPACK8108_LOCUS23476 [Phakopsora pachyrhizi]
MAIKAMKSLSQVVWIVSSTIYLIGILTELTLVFVEAKNQTATSQIRIDDYPCGGQGSKLELTPELWKASKMDEYMSSHPTLQSQTISQFAASVGMPNFFCGIGLECMAGQLCYPVIGKDYLILYSIQQWNNYMNSMYRIVADVINSLMMASSSIVTDFIPLGIKTEGSLFGWAIATIVFAAVGMFTGPAAPLLVSTKAAGETLKGAALLATTAEMAGRNFHLAVGAALGNNLVRVKSATVVQDGIAFERVASLAATGNAIEETAKLPKHVVSATLAEELKRTANIASASSQATRLRLKRDLEASRKSFSKRSILRKRAPPNVLAYTRWSFLDIHLGRLRNQIQNFVASSSSLALEAPIYTDKGIATSILKGSFLAPNPTWESLSENFKKVATLVSLSEFFVSIGFIAIIGQEKCDKKGPGGTFDKKDYLAHCDSKGIMRSIAMVDGSKIRNNIRSADLLKSKYGYDVEDLVKRAHDCQVKHGVYGSNTAPPPTEPNSICVFQLPTCDMTADNYKKAAGGEFRLSLGACKDVFKLPI